MDGNTYLLFEYLLRYCKVLNIIKKLCYTIVVSLLLRDSIP